jgi:hypothetical protein
VSGLSPSRQLGIDEWWTAFEVDQLCAFALRRRRDAVADRRDKALAEMIAINLFKFVAVARGADASEVFGRE